MKKILYGLLWITALSPFCCFGQTQLSPVAHLSSPDGRTRLDLSLSEEGSPYYQLQFEGKDVILPSPLGLVLKRDHDLKNDFTVESIDSSRHDSRWKPVWGEVQEIRDLHNELVVNLYQKSSDRKMRLRFRLFNDGLGFRYEFDKQTNLNYFQVQAELTSFRLAGDHKTFWIPGNFDSNEYVYTTSRFSAIDAHKTDSIGVGTHELFSQFGVQSPLLMKTDAGKYILIFEAAQTDYPAMHLLVDPARLALRAHLAPDAYGVKAFMQTPCQTPWRTVLVTDKATELLASKTILNLNEPCKIENTDFIHPCKYVGVWWEMHVPDHSAWRYSDERNVKLSETDWNTLSPNGRHGATTENTKKYIDFAAKYGFDGVLVEGWNVGWEDWGYAVKEDLFDFVTPYPDFDVQALTEYARQKGVKLIMHHETGGSATNYERCLDKAVEFMKNYGYDAVKTGYAGSVIPRGEHHDGQWMAQHYERVIKKMAENGIMIDEHEPARPTGQCRTWPNLLACEAARGNEYNAWSNGNPPEHETILPFTRLMGGPMDYTPGIFVQQMSHYQANNPCRVHTTLAKQLALYVTMYSPLQMAADMPENYEQHLDAFQFIRDVAVDWDDTRILEAEPGDYVTIARKAKGSEDWFVGAITDENARTATIDLSFLTPNKKYIADIYRDADNADWQSNPGAYTIEHREVKAKTRLKIKLAPGGGCAIRLKEVQKAAK